MANITSSSSSSSSSSFELTATTSGGGPGAGADGGQQPPQQLQQQQQTVVYPMVNEDDTPLPRHWSPKDRCNYLGLAQNNLRVLYKGSGKNHKDAASVRATHPIPTTCGIYYFEVKVISKGRDGYMGIGLSAISVSLNKLPGWDKSSYGYHGDDGNSFCCSGTGQPYGPTFTTGDVVGCCVNLIDGTCFYTKNGINLGIAFRDLPANLYPTVGLQTPGEVIEANFGQTPFAFRINDYIKEWEMKIRMKIDNFQVPNSKGEWQMALQKIVLTYLIHHGYYASAKALADSTRQELSEDKNSIQNRQKIQKLILSGRIGEAIETTDRLYPGLLQQNRSVLFMLKCRQFIEMVNGTDDLDSSSKSLADNPPFYDVDTSLGPMTTSSPPAFASHGSSPIHPGYQYHQQQPQQQGTSSSHVILPKNSHSPNGLSSNPPRHQSSLEEEEEERRTRRNSANLLINGGGGGGRLDASHDAPERQSIDSEDEMDLTEMEEDVCVVNGGTPNGTCLNGQNHFTGREFVDDKDVVVQRTRHAVYSEDYAVVERILHFGRDLHAMAEQMKREYGDNETNSQALKDAFSLLAYSDPWNSPVGHQLNPVQREPVCTALNSAILDVQGFPKQPPLEVAIAQATQCLKLMSKAGIGSCAFASVLDTLH